MTDEDATDGPSSDVAESSQEENKPTDDASSSAGTDFINDEALKSTGGIFDLLNTIYNDRYYWEIFKSTVIFIFALKLARECNMMRIPIREYKPFNRQ